MIGKRNLRQFQVYLRPKQIESLNNLSSRIEEGYEVKFPVSEFLRDAVDQFIVKTADEESLKSYMESKGW